MEGSTGTQPPSAKPESSITAGDPVHRDAQEQVVRETPAVVEHGLMRRSVQRHHLALRHELDAALGEPREDRLRGGRRRRDGGAERDHDLDPDIGAVAALAQVVVEQDRRLARRGRALEGSPADADDGRAGPEARDHLA